MERWRGGQPGYRAGGELPAGVGGKNLLAVALEKIRRALQSGAGDARVAGVVAKGEMELVGIGKGVAEISGQGAIYEIVVGSLAIGLEIGGCGRVIEFADEPAEVRAAAAGRKIAAFGIGGERRYAGLAAVGEELDNAGDGIAAVNRAAGS